MTSFAPNTTTRKGLEFSFAGCGFLGIYHLGVSACLKKYSGALLIENVAGASAGCFAGAALLASGDFNSAKESILMMAEDARSRYLGAFSPSMDTLGHLANGLRKVLPENAHELVNNKLTISVTRVNDGQNKLLSNFNSKEELIQALLCSSFIPGFCGLGAPRFRGVRYIDGGFSNNMPKRSDSAITVSPFFSEADICPRDCSSTILAMTIANNHLHINCRNIQRVLHALFPPSVEDLEDMYQRGYNDAYKFLVGSSLLVHKSVSFSRPLVKPETRLKCQTSLLQIQALEDKNMDSEKSV